MSNRILTTFGRWAAADVLLLAIALFAGCYGFQGGGGFPSTIRTLYIQPFDNQTAQFELDQQIFGKLLEQLPRALGVRPGGQEVADAIVRGKVTRYDDVAQNYRAGSEQQDVQVLQHQVTVTISVEVIDTRRRVVLWESSGLSGKGEYIPGQESDVDARKKAVDNLVQQIIDGAQSQW